MTVLLKDALKPNLIQTLEGQPCLMHAGPFANIAHGNSSLVADLIGLKLGDYVVTESGFGSDMGMEKFFDIVCRKGDLRPSAVVLVATVRALKHHGGVEDDPRVDRAAASRRSRARRTCTATSGSCASFGLPCVVAVNRRPGDTDEEVALVQPLALEGGALARGGERRLHQRRRGSGGAGRGRRRRLRAAVRLHVRLRGRRPDRREDPEGRDAGLRRERRLLLSGRGAQDKQFTDDGLDKLPICMAKTHLSLSADAALRNAPEDFTLPVRDIRAYTGAGWLVPLCGDIHADARPGQEPGGAQRGHRRRRPHRRPVLDALPSF